MTAKIWSYSGWINNADANGIRQGFKGVFDSIKETIISAVEAEVDGANTLCWITGRMNIIITTCPADGCAYINITTADDGRLYDLLSALPDYFDVLVNDADGGIYPAGKGGILIRGGEDNPDSEKEEETTQH